MKNFASFFQTNSFQNYVFGLMIRLILPAEFKDLMSKFFKIHIFAFFETSA